MTISRMHPVANWVRLAPHEHRRALDRVLAFRDAAPDPMASGLPEAAVQWFWSEELPRLCNRPEVRRQVEERIDDLVTQQSDIAAGLDQTTKALLERLQELQAEVAILEVVLA